MGRDPRLSQGGFFGVRMPQRSGGRGGGAPEGLFSRLPAWQPGHDVSLPAPAHQRLELHPKFSSWGARLKHWCEVTSQGYLRKGLT